MTSKIKSKSERISILFGEQVIRRLSHSHWIGVLALALLVIPGYPSAGAAERTNILVLLADDMGYGDAGVMGSHTLKTPNIDALAENGVLFSQAYVASAVCSPSRAGLMTGRDPRRFGYEANLNQAPPFYTGRPELLGLPSNEKTLADHLRSAGYSTGLIGKWHLGIGKPFHPNQRGFDYFCGMLEGSHNYFPMTVNHRIERNGARVEVFSNPYLTDFFTEEAIGYIQRQSERDPAKPWFLFVSFNAPHTPMQASAADLEMFSHIKNEKRKTYAAMVYAMDRGIGQIRRHLESTGQWENTLCVFLSDNGGATDNQSWNGPLRGVKGNLREGGIRVPMIWTWPDQIANGQVCNSVPSSLDLLPTFLEAAEADPLPPPKPLSHEDKTNWQRMNQFAGPYDGISLLPQLKDPSVATKRRLFWRLQGQSAVLDDKEKLVRLTHRRPEMFRPATDVSESNELSDSEAERADELLALLGQWEFTLPTMPAWSSSPYWDGQSAKNYDNWPPRPEPQSDDAP